jgi:ribosomal protein L37AE/L43A
MELSSRNARATHLSRPAVPCAQCGDRISAPEWSEVFDESRVRHLWSCVSCGYEFETTVFYPVAPDAKAA